MTTTTLISQAVAKAFPQTIKPAAGNFVRPEWTGDKTVYNSGYYWENLDGDRFYFPTYEDAAADFATDIGLFDDEAQDLLQHE